MSWQATSWVQSDSRIVTQMDYCVMINLADWVNDKGYWAPSHATWARASRCSVSSLRRSIQRMEAAGLIAIRSRGPNKTNLYYVLMPETELPPLIPDESVDNSGLPVHGEQARVGLPVHGEQLPVHLGEQLPVHLGEQRTTINNHLQPGELPERSLSTESVHSPEQIALNLAGLALMRSKLGAHDDEQEAG